MNSKKKTRIGNNVYVRDEDLSVGGMALVYRATLESRGKQVIVKEIRPQEQFSQSALEESFIREAAVTTQLQHPSIVKVHDFDTNTPVRIVYDYVDGLDLRDIRNLVGQMGEVETMVSMLWVCYALEEAHKKGVYHRDISPGNIMISRTLYWSMLTDFGIVATEEQYRKMNPEQKERPVGVQKYMSPEQREGLRVDGRSDIFQIGSVLVNMLTGRDPRYVDLNQRKLPFHKDIVAICRQATDFHPNNRFATVAKLREGIKRHLWTRKDGAKTSDDMHDILKGVMDRAYSNESATSLERKIDDSWQDIAYLSDVLEMSMQRRDSLLLLADEKRELAEDIFEEELILEVGGNKKSLFTSLDKIRGMSGSRFRDRYRRIYHTANRGEQSSEEFKKKVSDYLNAKLIEWRGYVATLLKINPEAYDTVIEKTEGRVSKTIGQYDHEHILNYDVKLQQTIFEIYDRSDRMTRLILRQLDPTNERYVDYEKKIKSRMSELEASIKREKGNGNSSI